MKKGLEYRYDGKYDILYVTAPVHGTTYHTEDDEGIAIKRNRATGEFAGSIIFDFKLRLADDNFPGINQFINLHSLRNVAV
jgi:hypothetical protein